MTTKRSRLSILPILAAALVVPVLACKDADSVTGVRLEPTPRQAASIVGAWTGRYSNVDCIDVPAQATFRENEFLLEGTLNATPDGCYCRDVVIDVTLAGRSLTGTIQSGPGRYSFGRGSTVTGSVLDDGTLRLTLINGGNSYNRGGTMELHR